MRKLAIVVGHNSERQGAVRQDTGESEYIWNGRLAKRIAASAVAYDFAVKIFKRTPGGGYTREIERVYAEVDSWGADASVELHFNSFSSSDATGTETLSSGTKLSLLLAEHVQREMVIALDLDDRGIKTRSSGRGSASLMSGKAPAILIEPFFGSSVSDTSAVDSEAERDDLALAILAGVAEAFERFPRSSLDDSRTMHAVKAQKTAATTGIGAAVLAAATPLAEGLIGDADTVADAISVGERIGALLPWAGTVPAVVSVVAFIYLKKYAGNIELARVDDFIKALR